MESSQSNALNNKALVKENLLNETLSHKESMFCCCITNRWCFEHTGIPLISKEYDESNYNCCTCLDCCSWCLEFKFNKCSLCVKQVNIYLCCFTIYFI